MRAVVWTDERGYLRRSLVRDDDTDERASIVGISAEPPDLDRLDFGDLDIDIEEFKKKLHNRLVQTGLITWLDVQRSQNGLTRAMMAAGRDRKIVVVLKRQLVALYRQEV